MICDAPSLYAASGGYLDTTNDSFGGIRDDYLTATLRGRIEGERVYLIASDMMMTWKHAGQRTDQASLILGGKLPYLHLGIGGVIGGNLGGEGVQNTIHRTFHRKVVWGTYYPPGYHLEPAVSAEFTYQSVDLCASATPKSLQVTPMVRIGTADYEVGLGYAYYTGPDLSPVAHKAAETMTGLRVTAGLNHGHFALGVECSGATILCSIGASL